MFCTWISFMLGSLILISLSFVYGQRSDIFCYYAAENVCKKTTETYSKLCFASFASCRKFSVIPFSMWKYSPKRKACVKTDDRGTYNGDTLFDSPKFCQVVHVTNPHFTYDPKAQICLVSYRPSNLIPYRTAALCRDDNGRRYCIVRSESSVECAQFSSRTDKHKLCFGFKDDCESYVERDFPVWFHSPMKNSCSKIKSGLKKSNEMYYISRKQCQKNLPKMKRVKTCHKIQDGTCRQVSDDKSCNLLEYSFNTHQDCMECLSNYENQDIAFMTHQKDNQCRKSDLNHRFLYLHCSMAQCLYRQNMTNTVVSVKKYGPYYMGLNCAPLPQKEHPGQMYMFKSESECRKKLKEDKELRERSVGYRYRPGDCQPTMDLKSPGFFKTKDDCRHGTHVKKEQYLVDVMSFCNREKTLFSERGRRAWFGTLEECKKYLEDRATMKKTFMERSYGTSILSNPLDYFVKKASSWFG